MFIFKKKYISFFFLNLSSKFFHYKININLFNLFMFSFLNHIVLTEPSILLYPLLLEEEAFVSNF
jgi:hypothetical protein